MQRRIAPSPPTARAPFARVRRGVVALGLLTLTATAACDDEDDGGAGDTDSDSDTGAVAVDYETQIQPIFNNNCTCHLMGPSGSMFAPYLTLNPGTSISQLVDVASEQSALARVLPGDPQGSYLFRKLEGTHLEAGGSGDRMPQGTELSAADIELVRSWILGGANP